MAALNLGASVYKIISVPLILELLLSALCNTLKIAHSRPIIFAKSQSLRKLQNKWHLKNTDLIVSYLKKHNYTNRHMKTRIMILYVTDEPNLYIKVKF